MKAEYSMIKDKREKAFLLTSWKEGIDPLEEARKIIFLWLGIVSILGWLGSILELSYSPLFVFGTALFLSAVIQIGSLLLSQLQIRILYAGYIVIPLLSILSSTIQTGISGLFHDASKVLAMKGIILFYRGSYSESILAKSLVLIFLSAWLILLMRILLKNSGIPLAVIFILMLLMEMKMGGGDSGIWLIVWVCWLSLPYVTSMRSYLFLFLPLMIFTLIFAFLFGTSSEDGWKNTWNRIRYRENVKLLPDGDLTQAVEMKRDSKTVITVDSEHRGYYYLKGFVGSEYSDSRWHCDSQITEDFETGIIGGNSEFLDWFHQKGLSGYNELSSRVEGGREQFLTIHNKRANRRYVYVPYELVSTASQIEKEGIGVYSRGETLLATGLFGKKTYQYKTRDSMSDTELRTRDDEKIDTRKAYDAYEEYVNRTYLVLPKEIKEMLKDLFGGTNTIGVDDTLAIVKKVRRWLRNNVTYNENPGKIRKHEDFIKYFLEGDRQGYDVHYATLAVMFFRYYGIPSRYVEGYLLEDSGVISENNAHAWPEIYISGCGWIPVEVMESYQNRMPSYLEEDGGSIYSENDNVSPEQKEDSGSQNPQNPENPQNPQDPEEKHQAGYVEEEEASVLPLILLIFLILALVIATIVVIVFRMKEFSFRRRAMHSISPERCIIMWYQYCIWLLYELEDDPQLKAEMTIDNRVMRWEERWKKRHPEVNMRTLRQVGLLRQKAVYRKQGIDWKEAENAVLFFEDEYRFLFRQLSFGNKCKVRLGLRPAFLRRKSLF